MQDGKVEPEDFTSRLQKELKSSPQPYLVPFLKVKLNLTAMRHSFVINWHAVLLVHILVTYNTIARLCYM